jgi:hypothetical protein
MDSFEILSVDTRHDIVPWLEGSTEIARILSAAALKA